MAPISAHRDIVIGAQAANGYCADFPLKLSMPRADDGESNFRATVIVMWAGATPTMVEHGIGVAYPPLSSTRGPTSQST
jgi:hypothetical protein